MKNIVLVLSCSYVPGATVRIPAVVEAKHYPLTETANALLSAVASAMRLQPDYWEEADE